jgi:hypothetical protein
MTAVLAKKTMENPANMFSHKNIICQTLIFSLKFCCVLEVKIAYFIDANKQKRFTA